MAHVLEHAQVNTPGKPTREYRWAILGRAVYCDWWSEPDARHYKDLRAARDVVDRSSKPSWFEWSDGSTPAHWKWPEWYQLIARDGLPVWFKEAPKQWIRPQRRGATHEIHEQMKDKLSKVRNRRYIQGPTESFNL